MKDNLTTKVSDEAQSPAFLVGAVISRAFVNVYNGDDNRFLSDEDYDSYEAAFEGRDKLSSYVETVEIVRQHGVIGSASSLTIKHQIEMDEEGWGDEGNEDEILGYECLRCGNIQDNDSGFGCDKCLGHCLEPSFG